MSRAHHLRAAARAALVVCLAAPALLWGAARLPLPPLDDPDRLKQWAETVRVESGAMAVLVLAGLAFAALLALVALLHLLAAGAPGRGLGTLAVRLTPALLRAGLGAGAIALVAAPPRPAGAQFADAHEDPATPEREVITMRHLDGERRSSPAGQPSPVISATPPAASPEEWTVARGEHLWGIAAEVLTDHLGRPPTDGETARYWRVLIEANRSRLVVPDDPDLILPGQRLVVPAPSGQAVSSSGPAGS